MATGLFLPTPRPPGGGERTVDAEISPPASAQLHSCPIIASACVNEIWPRHLTVEFPKVNFNVPN